MAELMGTLLYANTFTADCIRIVTESAEFARRLPYLLRKAAATKFDVLPEAGVSGGRLRDRPGKALSSGAFHDASEGQPRDGAAAR